MSESPDTLKMNELESLINRAEAVLARLELGSYFEGVFDIVASELEPKPSRS